MNSPTIYIRINSLKDFETVKENYYINDLFQIYNKNTNKYIKPCIMKIGYYMIGLGTTDTRKGKKFYLHRLIMRAFKDNETEGFHIDHINRDKTNNSINNLRFVSRRINQENRNVQCNNKLGEKNIYFSEKEQRYIVDIRINNKRKIKRTKTLEEAILFRNNYVKQYTL